MGVIGIRRVYSSALPSDRARIEQVQKIFRKNFPYAAAEADRIPDLLNHPFDYGYRTVLLVSESALGNVTGFSLFLHFPEVNSSFLDYIAVKKITRGGGLGGALYEATREYLRNINSRGLYLEVLPDDPDLVSDPVKLKENRKTLRFYEQYGVRPITGTLYEQPTEKLQAGYLMFDGLGRRGPLGRAEARAAARLIIRRKHGDTVGPDYIERVVESFIEDPVRFRPPRYVRTADQPREVSPSRLIKSFALVSSESHAIHLVRQPGYVQRPARVGAIMEALSGLDLFAAVPVRHFGEGVIRAVHDGDFVTFLKAVCQKLESKHPVYPYVFPIRRPEKRPKDLSVRAGYYCIDTFTPLDRNAYRAARSAVDVAMTAAGEILAGCRVAFALCRPPGHHAGKRTFGGFCYFNNAAIAAHHLSRTGPVAVLDIDYHHGNGTQEIFYRRREVLTVSLHGHPNVAYPHFSGFADEVGEGPGRGFNRNFPLPEHADEKIYWAAFEKAIGLIQRFRPDFLVVSLGLDTLKGDPTGSFTVPVRLMKKIGNRLGGFGMPLLIVQEGGYSIRNLKRGTPALFLGIADSLREKYA